MDRILSAQAASHKGDEVRLAGWVHNLRIHKDVQFLVLRDRGGLIQAVAKPCLLYTSPSPRDRG